MHDAEHFRRQWRLYQSLCGDPVGMTITELADTFGVSSKTIQRDLSTLRSVDIPLDEEVEQHGRKRWKVPFDTSRVPKFTFEEAAAIYLGRRFLDPLAGTLLWNAAQRAYVKLKATFTQGTLKFLEDMASDFHQTAIGSSDYAQRAEWIDLLMQSIEDHKVTTIEYHSLKSDAPRPISVQPLGMIYHEGSLFLVAIAEEHGQVRHYKIDRLSGVDITENRFTPPEGFDLKQHLSGTLGVYGVDPNQPLRTVRIRFAVEAARYIQEHTWHESQSLEPQPDGTVICTLQLKSLVEVQSWILSFGPRAEALEPPELRLSVAESLQETLGRYRKL